MQAPDREKSPVAAVDGRRLEAGSLVGDFEVVEPIGRGGFGEVFRARQRSLGGRLVALKVLHRDALTAGARARFTQEAAIAARLHHPHLAEVHGFGEEPELGALYYAMRLVEGPTLDAVLQRAARSPAVVRSAEWRRRTVASLAQIADALAVVHRAGLVHRDVKPSNVLLDGEAGDLLDQLARDAVLVDFGLARAVDAASGCTTVLAPLTLAYAAPEQYHGGEPTARVDVFALGATLHDLLTGRRGTDRERAAAGLEPVAELVPEVDADLAAIVGTATDVLPRWRYPDAGAMAEDLIAWLERRPVRARRVGFVWRLVRGVQRRPGRSAAIGALAAVAVLLLLGAVALTRAVAGALDARAAWRGREVPQLAAALERTPGWVGPFLEERLAAIARSFRSETESDPIASVLSTHRRLGDRDAVLHAARLVRTFRPDGRGGIDREVCDWLLQALLSRVDAARPSEADSIVVPAVKAIARHYVDCPVESPAEIGATARVRARLLSVARDPGLGILRSDAIAGLGGCATALEVDELASFAFGATGDRSDSDRTELARIARMSLERTLRRAHRDGSLVRLDASTLQRLLDRATAAWRDRIAAGGAELPERISHAMLAAAFAARALGHEVEVDFDFLRSVGPQFAASFGAVLGDPGSVDRCRPDQVLGRDGFDPSRDGWRCAAAQDPTLEAEWRRWLAGRPREEADAFERGLQAGLDEAHGRIADADLLLAPLLPGDPVVAGPTRRLTLPELRSSLRSIAGTVGDLERLDFAAIWDARREELRMAGLAAGVVSAATQATTPGADHSLLKMPSPGTSRVHLCFRAEEQLNAREYLLLLDLTKRISQHRPFEGSVVVELTLDDKPIQERLQIHADSSGYPSAHRLVPAVLEAGDHAVTIRLLDESDTAAQLNWAALVQLE